MSIELGNIVSIAKGKKHDNVFPSNGIGKKRYIQIEDLRNDNNLKYTSDTGVEVSENDMIIAWDGANAGTIGFGLNGFIGSTLARLRFKENGFDTNYLGWFLRSKFDYLRNKCTGATIPHINKVVLESLKIPSLDLKTQKEIAHVLEQADKARQQRKAANVLTDQFLQSSFLSLFGDPVKNEKGWREKKIKEILEIRGRVGWKGYKRTDLRNSGPYVLGATHILRNGDIDLSEPVFISREKFEESPEITIVKDDLLIVQRGNTIAKVCLVDKEIGEATINPCILIMRPLKANSRFLKYLFLNKKINEMLWNMNTSSAQPMLTQENIRNFEIILPPLSLQQQFASIVAQVDQLRQKQRESERELKGLFQSLLQRYFG